MKKNYLILLIVLIFGLTVGFFLGKIPANKFKILKYKTEKPETINKNDFLSGEVQKIKKSSVLFKTRVMAGEDLIMAEKEAMVNEQTLIYNLIPKESEDYFGEEISKKLADLKEKARIAAQKKDRTTQEKIIKEIRTLTESANEQHRQQVLDLEKKISALSVNDPQAIELKNKLDELNSIFKMNPIKLEEIKEGASVKVWSEEDYLSLDRFTANKIEIKNNGN